MNVPINNRIRSAFVHVKDLKRSTEWYNMILGLPIKPERVNGGPIYWYDFGLILDDNRNNQDQPSHPICMLDSDDIDAACEYLKEKGVNIIREVERHPGIAFFNYEDFEGNVFMVCGSDKPRNEEEKKKAKEKFSNKDVMKTESPIKCRMPGVFINVKDMKRAIDWHSDILGLPVKPENDSGGIYQLPMDNDMDILIDNNRYLQGDDYKTQFMFETDDIDEAYRFLKEKDVKIFTGIERYPDAVSFLTFMDPDGNILMACENHQ